MEKSLFRWMPVGIAPMEPTISTVVPTGNGWIHETRPAHGVRVIARIRDGEVRLAEDGVREYEPRSWAIPEALALLPCREAIIDGELAPDERASVQSRHFAEYERWHYFAFDLLWLDGKDLRSMPLLDRKALLEILFRSVRRRLVFIEHVDWSQGEILYRSATASRQRGIVSRRAQSSYTGGFSRHWLMVRSGTVQVPAQDRHGSIGVLPPQATRQTSLPERVGIMLPTRAGIIPSGDNWFHEMQRGHRSIAYLRNGSIRIMSPEWQDRTHQIAPDLIEAFRDLQDRDAIMDGELGVAYMGGLMALQLALRDPKLTYYAFDLLWLDGEDIRNLPLLERKKRLRSLLSGRNTKIAYAPHARGRSSGRKLFDEAAAYGFSGIISKRIDSRYTEGKSVHWVSIRTSGKAYSSHQLIASRPTAAHEKS
jgi:ATP-dependent DNA ligase